MGPGTECGRDVRCGDGGVAVRIGDGPVLEPELCRRSAGAHRCSRMFAAVATSGSAVSARERQVEAGPPMEAPVIGRADPLGFTRQGVEPGRRRSNSDPECGVNRRPRREGDPSIGGVELGTVPTRVGREPVVMACQRPGQQVDECAGIRGGHRA